MTWNYELGRRLQSLRKDNNWTLARFSDLTGTHENHLKAIESGLSNPSRKDLNSFCFVLKISSIEQLRCCKKGQVCPDDIEEIFRRWSLIRQSTVSK